MTILIIKSDRLNDEIDRFPYKVTRTKSTSLQIKFQTSNKNFFLLLIKFDSLNNEID